MGRVPGGPRARPAPPRPARPRVPRARRCRWRKRSASVASRARRSSRPTTNVPRKAVFHGAGPRKNTSGKHPQEVSGPRRLYALSSGRSRAACATAGALSLRGPRSHRQRGAAPALGRQGPQDLGWLRGKGERANRGTVQRAPRKRTGEKRTTPARTSLLLSALARRLHPRGSVETGNPLCFWLTLGFCVSSPLEESIAKPGPMDSPLFPPQVAREAAADS